VIGKAVEWKILIVSCVLAVEDITGITCENVMLKEKDE
jgi:hypothetical protein